MPPVLVRRDEMGQDVSVPRGTGRRLCDLPYDVCRLISWFVGAGRDSNALSLSSRAWYDHVRASDVWEDGLARCAPRLHKWMLESAAAGGSSATVNWHMAFVRSRQKQLASDNSSKPCTSEGRSGLLHTVRGWLVRKNKSRKAVILGTPGAGVTTILYKLKLVSGVDAIPLIGFSMEEIECYGVSLAIWLGGSPSRIFYLNTHCIIYVMDTRLEGLLAEGLDALQRLLSDERLGAIPLLVFANKQDASGAVCPCEVANSVSRLAADRPWCVQGCCAISGDGLMDGMAWLCRYI